MRCRCGHSWLAHDHYRPGTDCGLCECGRYKRRPWWRPIRRRSK